MSGCEVSTPPGNQEASRGHVSETFSSATTQEEEDAVDDDYVTPIKKVMMADGSVKRIRILTPTKSCDRELEDEMNRRIVSCAADAVRTLYSFLIDAFRHEITCRRGCDIKYKGDPSSYFFRMIRRASSACLATLLHRCLVLSGEDVDRNEMNDMNADSYIRHVPKMSAELKSLTFDVVHVLQRGALKHATQGEIKWLRQFVTLYSGTQ